MPIKTFSQAEQLTAADTNAFLTNGGLVYITETSFTAQTSVIVDNCFTSTYANYRIVLDLSAASATDLILFQWRTGGSSGSTYGTADYDNQILEAQGATVTGSASMGVVYGRLGYVYGTPGYFFSVVDLINPQAAFRAMFSCASSSPNGTTNILQANNSGQNRVTTSFTGIRIGNLIGTTTMTGRLKIYGYRNA